MLKNGLRKYPKYIDKKALYEHIGSKHPEQIPVGMPVSQVYFNNKFLCLIYEQITVSKSIDFNTVII